MHALAHIAALDDFPMFETQALLIETASDLGTIAAQQPAADTPPADLLQGADGVPVSVQRYGFPFVDGERLGSVHDLLAFQVEGSVVLRVVPSDCPTELSEHAFTHCDLRSLNRNQR